jgi:hypothetical protein
MPRRDSPMSDGPSQTVLDELLRTARRRARADARVVPLADLRRQVARMPSARRFEAALRSWDRF